MQSEDLLRRATSLLRDAFDLPLSESADYRIGSTLLGVHFGRDRSGLVCLLIPLETLPENSTGRQAAGLELNGYSNVSFSLGGVTSHETAAVLTCLSSDLTEAFALLAADLIQRTTGTPRQWAQLLAIVSEWQRLLAPRARLTQDEEIGLWGELWFMSRFLHADAGFQAWRGHEGDSTDFWAGGVGIEVKTSRQKGLHFVSQAQVTDEPEGRTWFLSLWVRPDATAGISLDAQVLGLASRVSDVVAFRRALAGVGLSRVDSGQHSTPYSLVDRPSWYPSHAIPRIRAADAGITQIRYRLTLPEHLKISDSVANDNWLQITGTPEPR